MESSETLLRSMFFDPKRYDLAKVGRYKFNKKLALRNRVKGAKLAENVVDAMTGEVVAEAGMKLTLELCDEIQNTGTAFIYIEAEEIEDRKVKILTNQVVDIDPYLAEFDLTGEDLNIKEKVYYPVLVKILENFDTAEEVKAAIKKISMNYCQNILL